MTLTLRGWIQTRLVLLSSVGLIWTLAIAPFLPRPAGTPGRLAYQITLETSVAMTLLGIGWESVYYGLQQLRWDKDWPSVLSLLAGAVEAVYQLRDRRLKSTVPFEMPSSGGALNGGCFRARL